MSNSPLDVSSHGQVNLAQFARDNPLQVGGKTVNSYESGILQIKGVRYQVSIQGSQISVTREGGVLKNLFSRNYSSTLQSKLQREMGEQLTTQAGVYKEAMQARILEVRNRDMMRSQFQSVTDGTKPQVEIASYGFDTVRTHASAGVSEYNASPDAKVEVRLNKIDVYNGHLGIKWETAEPVNLPKLLSDIRSGALAWSPQTGSQIQQSAGESWRAFLQQNVHKLDIFSKITHLEQISMQPAPPGAKQSGWEYQARTKGAEATIEAFVRKNITPSFNDRVSKDDIRTVARLLREFSSLVTASPTGVPSDRELDDFVKTKLYAPSMTEGAYYAFSDMTKSAFFRQTSKLGLEFFQSRGVPVMFQWTDSKGIDFENAHSQGAPHRDQKWWHDQSVPVTGHFAPITFSEMRHTERLAGFHMMQIKALL
jgi:hypothetical protein